ncbi:MAG TPA: hypothetical protein VD930_00405 [Gemmatimonadales bacterium]|nr:hypothetical protein [Gemmatimonadales bacterium]
MLPAGLTADLAASGPRTALQQLHPSARTVAELLVGACSCDLVRPRQANTIEDERDLRARYHRARLPRSEIIKELERHRRGPARRQEPAHGWPAALAAFAAEHARNAGPTLYLLHFGPRHLAYSPPLAAPAVRTVSEVRQQSIPWLIEGHPVEVR